MEMPGERQSKRAASCLSSQLLGKLKQKEHTFEAWLSFRVSSKQYRMLRETASKNQNYKGLGIQLSSGVLDWRR